MPKSQLDWLGVVSLWVGAVVLASKSAEAPLMSGAPSWLAAPWWNYVPVVLVSFYLLGALYRLFASPRPAVAVPAPAPAIDDGKRDARRKLIVDGRRLIAEFNQQVRQPTLIGFLQYREEWPAIRAQLDPKVRQDLENGRMVVVTHGPEKDGKVYRLMDELARLEREWDLS